MVTRTYLVITEAKVDGRYFTRGNVVSDEIASLGHPSLKSLGVLMPISIDDQDLGSDARRVDYEEDEAIRKH